MTFIKPDMSPEYVTESEDYLARMLGDLHRPISTVVTWVNRTGDNGAVKVLIAFPDCSIVDITWHVARVLNSRVKNGGVEVCGGQVNRHCELAHRIWRHLELDGIPKYHEMTGA